MNSNLSNIDHLLNLNNVKSTFVDSISNIILHKGEFSIFQINISSISAHFNDLEILLSSFKSTFNKSDGVTVLIRQSIKLLQIQKQILLNCNSIQLIFQIDKSPNDNLELFLKSLDLILPEINVHYKSIICGDININILINSNISNDYLNIMARNGFLPCINNFTRETNRSKTCIDHIFIKNIVSTTVKSNILKCDITDHYPTILIISNINNNEKITCNNSIKSLIQK
ncbi:otoferlin-like [Aphis craccivora]|uniref:Otoferlin-like n=1 Tax=Aphis craccivora TaxID=307492 RepID=A0A6G0VR17_APHCR|nr:otoferlin-like [Aphis craccivora]